MGEKDDVTKATEDTEQSAVYDTILACCCEGPSLCSPDEPNEGARPDQQGRPPSSRPSSPKGGGVGGDGGDDDGDDDDDDEVPRFWERVADVALYLIGAAPPVKFVRCYGCAASVDGSELTLPRVLSALADEYDGEGREWQATSPSEASEGGGCGGRAASGEDPRSADEDRHRLRGESRRRRRTLRRGKIKANGSQKSRQTAGTNASTAALDGHATRGKRIAGRFGKSWSRRRGARKGEF